MNVPLLPGLIMMLIGVVIVVVVFAPPHVPWPSEVIHETDNNDQS